MAKIRLKRDEPDSAYFYNKKIRLRIDLLFDFPKPTEKIAALALVKKLRSYIFRIAAVEDLKQLKALACKNRALAADKQDLDFLQKLDLKK